MRRFAVRILIALLTFTAGVFVSRLFFSTDSQFQSFQAVDRVAGWKRGCRKRRAYARLVQAPAPPRMDVSLLQPHDAVYDEALEFANFLRENGIRVRRINRSKFESLFKGSDRAAHFRTESGTADVIFFSDSRGAEKIRVSELSEGERYIYELQAPDETQMLNSATPNYIIRHQHWFISTPSEQLAAEIHRAL